MVPLTGSPAARTDTCVSLPWSAVTVMPWPGCTSLLPSVGVIVTSLGAADLLAFGLPEWLEPPLAVLPVPPEQGAASRPATAQIVIAASRLRGPPRRAGAVVAGGVLTGGLPGMTLTAGPAGDRLRRARPERRTVQERGLPVRGCPVSVCGPDDADDPFLVGLARLPPRVPGRMPRPARQ